MTGLAAGLTVRVPARGVVTVASVRAGETWVFRARGCWVDSFIPCGPAGYRNPLANLFGIRPKVAGRFFCLVGALGEEMVMIGEGCTHRFATSGELRAFANDAADYEWNNWGAVSLEGTVSDSTSGIDGNTG